MSRKLLLGCGVASTAVYLAMDIVGSMWWEGYSYIDQTISELAAIGAPSRIIAVTLGTAYNLLLIPFAAGIAAASRRNTMLRGTAAGFSGVALAGIAAAFFPIQQRGQGVWTINETMHITLTAITVLCIVLAMVFGASAGGPNFFLYSMASASVMLLAGALTGLNGGNLAANLPTPWMGVMERISIFSFLAWVATLSVMLLRARDSSAMRHA